MIIIQFLKGRKDIGEYLIAQKLKPYFKIFQFGRKEFVNLKKPDPLDVALAKKGLAFARRCLREKPKLLILDEVNLAIAAKLLPENEVIAFLKKIPKTIDVVLTGRHASRRLYRIADGISVVKKVKHVYDRGVAAREGIEF